MLDILPEDCYHWQKVESIARQHFHRAGIKEIRTPIIEMTELFSKGIGEGTDVVGKDRDAIGTDTGEVGPGAPGEFRGHAEAAVLFVEIEIFPECHAEVALVVVVLEVAAEGICFPVDFGVDAGTGLTAGESGANTMEPLGPGRITGS